MMGSKQYHIIFDIGGTSLRSALYDPATREISQYKVSNTENFLCNPTLTEEELKTKLENQLIGMAESYRAEFAITKMGLSFAGPINSDNEVLKAPTIIGKMTQKWRLKDKLQSSLSMPVKMINDISAAAYFFSNKYEEPFCVFTISSGIGNKVFFNNQVLLHADGYGGELGHYRCDYQDDINCDCGGVGHLGAISSGRGFERMFKQEAKLHPEKFKESKISKIVGDIDQLTNYQLIEAFKDNDPFTVEIMKKTLRPLAQTIDCLFCAIGIKKFIFIGGFVQAAGRRYIDLLHQQLIEASLFNLSHRDREELLVLADETDPCLKGMACYLALDNN